MAGTSERPAAADDVLVARAREGDMAAFEELVMANADRLFMALRRFGLTDDEAQEVAQETFLRAWRALASFEGRSQFFTWIYRIGFNEAQRKLGRRKPAPVSPGAGGSGDDSLDPLDAVPDGAPGPDERAEQRELLAHLAEALGELPRSLREPVLLRDVEGLSTAEAASVLEVGEAAFKSRLHRGRLALRELVALPST